MKRSEEEKMIGSMLCYNKVKAARYIGVSLSTINNMILEKRAGKLKNFKFIQHVKNAPMWFPVEFLDSYLISNLRDN